MYDPPGVGGTHVIYVLHDINNPEAYGGLPKDPRVPWLVRMWKGPLKWLGNLAMTAGVLGVAAHYLRFGPKRRRMSDEIVRYTFAERLIHWFGGLTYLYLLMSGLALYSPYLYWMASVLGGGPAARFWHPWIGLLFVIVIALDAQASGAPT